MSDFGEDVEVGEVGGDDGDDGGDYDDTYQEETYDSWGSRLKSACAGICLGLILFVGAFPLLYWNEGRAVERYDTLAEGQQTTTSISATSLSSSNDGGLVHFTAVVKSMEGNLTDPVFGITTDDLKLRRSVEMYQWKERKQTKKVKKAGGGTKTTTTYSYYEGWDAYAVSSSNFRRPDGHENPGAMRFEQLVVAADTITAGEFVLPTDIVERISWYTSLSGVSKEDIPDETLRSEAREFGSGPNGFYLGSGSASSPSVGDTRVTFDAVQPGIITVVAQQNGNTFSSYEAEAGGTILLFKQGNHTLDAMYDAANYENNVTTWILRFVGFLVMGFGIYLVLRPVEVFADVIPCVGSIIGCGIAFLAFFLAGLLSGLTISIAWLIHHPMIGGIVLAAIFSFTVGVGLLVKYVQKKKQKKNDDGDHDDDNGKVVPGVGGGGDAGNEAGFQNDLELSPEAAPHQPTYVPAGGNENEVELSTIPTTQGYAIPTTQGYAVDSSPAGAGAAAGSAPIPVTQGVYVVDSYPSAASTPGNAGGY